MSEREELAEVVRHAYENESLTSRGWGDNIAHAILASPWLRAHDDRIRAEALAPVLALADEVAAEIAKCPPLTQWGDHGKRFALERTAAALRAAAGTPTHHTTEED